MVLVANAVALGQLVKCRLLFLQRSCLANAHAYFAVTVPLKLGKIKTPPRFAHMFSLKKKNYENQKSI